MRAAKKLKRSYSDDATTSEDFVSDDDSRDEDFRLEERPPRKAVEK